MPNLPTITLTDAQLAKCVEAFTDANGYKEGGCVEPSETRSSVATSGHSTSNTTRRRLTP